MTDLNQRIEDIFPEIVDIRRDIHRHPEMGFKEFRTAKIIADYLKALGMEVQEGVFGTGVVGLLKGDHPGKVFAMRADIDALPVAEETGLPFQSEVEGVMHACGHDGHTAMLLGAAKLLSERKDQLHGAVKFIFQPAEEQAPDGGGARPMIEEGVLQNPKVDAIMAFHIYPDVESGHVRIAEPYATTGADAVEIEVFGKGGHASKPNESVDALLTACKIVDQLQTIVSRNVDPQEMAAISICKMESGTASNIISDYAYMLGSVRMLSMETREIFKKGMQNAVDGVAKAMGATAKLNYKECYNAVHNDDNLRKTLEDVVIKTLGEDKLERVLRPITGAEDFSAFIDYGEIPGVMAILGASIPSPELYMNHHPKFDWDEEAMKTGMNVFVEMTTEFLKE